MFPFPNIKSCTTFPIPEGPHLELKRGFNSCPHDKIIATICAFLNSGGGYIVVGVEDATREIVGFKADKIMDFFQLAIDNIFHIGLIKNLNGYPLSIDAIKTEIVPTANNKEVYVITVTPDVGAKYMMKEGSLWYRLSASNYKQTAIQTVYTEQEVKIIVAQRLADQKTSHQSEHEKLKSKFKTLESDIEKLVVAARDTEKTLQEFRELMYASIKQQKDEAESELIEKKRVCWFHFLCCRLL